MRIMIDVPEGAPRSATVLSEPGVAAAAEPPAMDGGEPSEALLLSLGAASPQGGRGAAGTVPGGGAVGGIDAGRAPEWLEQMIRTIRRSPG
jgi:hypothetical protein